MEERLFQILQWIVYGSISGEDLLIASIPDNDEFTNQEAWMQGYFGNSTPSEIPGGEYLFYYQSRHDWVVDKRGNNILPDAEIEIPTRNGFDYIYLYRIG